MKKVLFILLGILCAVSAGAAKYGTLYRGSGRGVIYTMSSSNYSAASAGLAPAPVATMGSVSPASTGNTMRGASAVRTMTTAMTVVAQSRGIYTAATAVSGGVTTYDNGGGRPHKGGVRRDPTHPDDAEECQFCHDGDDDGICDICGCDIGKMTGGQCSGCVTESGYCWCPIDFSFGVYLFLAMMATGYGVWKRRTA